MRGRIALAVLGMLVAAAALLVHLFGLAVACGLENTSCAQSSDKNGAYQGQLVKFQAANQPGRMKPYADGTFLVSFESREERPPVPFHTDATGRFCVVWAQEGREPLVEGTTHRSLLARILPTADLPYEGADRFEGTLGRWEPARPPGCEESDEGIPWNRGEDLASTWQSWLLIILPLAALGVLLASVFRRRAPSSRWLHFAGVSLSAASALALLVLWSFFGEPP